MFSPLTSAIAFFAGTFILLMQALLLSIERYCISRKRRAEPVSE